MEVQFDADDFRFVFCGVRADQRGWKNDEHWDFVCVCDCVRRDHYYEEDASGYAAAVQDSAGATFSDTGDRGECGDDVWIGLE